jgi:hypothetical protein
MIVLLGVIFGTQFLKLPPHLDAKDTDLLEAFFQYDGKYYRHIASNGYQYVPRIASEVAFFPLYPCTARLISLLTGCTVEWGLLLTTHLALVLAFVLLHVYTRVRTECEPSDIPILVNLSFALLPTTFFFRMGYSEALFFALTLLTMLGIERRWPLVVIALLTGVATAARPVGVALVPVFLLHLWHRSSGIAGFTGRVLTLTPLACVGLLAYMGYQWWAFGEPLAFAKAQMYWRGVPPVPWAEKLKSLAILEPIWNPYVPGSVRYWERYEVQYNPVFSLAFLNPIAFVVTAGMIVAGAYMRWLNVYEWLLAFGLLAIPYLTRGYDFAMLSSARFAAAVVPAYLVFGQLLVRLPPPLPGLLAGLGGFLLGAYAALFAAGYRMF